MLEERIVRFCAPTLAGIKTGGLFNTCGMDEDTVRNEADSLSNTLEARGLALRIYEKPGRKSLIYFYRKSALAADLANPEIARFLAEYGYRTDGVTPALARLGERIRECERFPHEIGVFLSYPLSDVRAFIELGGNRCKTCGYWCVYNEEDKARRCFNRYDKCGRRFNYLYQRGRRIGDLAVAR